MANEITHALQQTNGGQVASILATDELIPQLFDATDLRPLMQFHDLDGLIGSDTVDITQDAVPQAAAAATNETTGGQANTAYTTSRFSLTWARYVLQYELTDLLTVNDGPVQLAQVLRNMNLSIGLTMTDLLTALFPAIANAVGATGVDLSIDNMYSAMFQLNSQSVPGPYAAVLHPQQFNDFQTSNRGEVVSPLKDGGADSMLADLSGPGFKGTWNAVRLFQSDSVTLVNTSADRSGAMFGFGAFGYTIRSWRKIVGAPAMLDPGDVLADLGVAWVERNRDHTNAMSEGILNFYPAVVEQEDLRAVEIITDA